MIDYAAIAVGDIRRSLAFHDQALAPLGIKRLRAYGGHDETPAHIGYGGDQKFNF